MRINEETMTSTIGSEISIEETTQKMVAQQASPPSRLLGQSKIPVLVQRK